MTTIDQIVSNVNVSNTGECGVYVLIRNKLVVYVGRTNNISRRIKDHSRDKIFDTYQIIPITDSIEMSKLELMMINLLSPEYNTLIRKEENREDFINSNIKSLEPMSDPFRQRDDSEVLPKPDYKLYPEEILDRVLLGKGRVSGYTGIPLSRVNHAVLCGDLRVFREPIGNGKGRGRGYIFKMCDVETWRESYILNMSGRYLPKDLPGVTT